VNNDEKTAWAIKRYFIQA